MYKRFTHQQRYVFKMGVIGLIEAITRGDYGGSSIQGSVVLNLNLNIAKAEISGYDILKDRVKQLKEELKEVRDAYKFYKAKSERLENEVKRLSRELELKDREISRLHNRIKELNPEAVKVRAEQEVVRRVKGTLITLVKSGVLTKEQLNLIYKALGW